MEIISDNWYYIINKFKFDVKRQREKTKIFTNLGGFGKLEVREKLYYERIYDTTKTYKL